VNFAKEKSWNYCTSNAAAIKENQGRRSLAYVIGKTGVASQDGTQEAKNKYFSGAFSARV
jgi:hypothetical protein